MSQKLWWLFFTALSWITCLSECKIENQKDCDSLSSIVKLQNLGNTPRYSHHGQNGTMPIEQCPEGTYFDKFAKRCLPNGRKRKKSKRSTTIVGNPCSENIDCQTTDGGSYCSTTKTCDCLPAYVNINGYCWPKRNPGENCLYQDQCTGVSPNSYCHSSGQCMCTNNQPSYSTDDGPACIIPGECPTNGINSKLRDKTGSSVSCATFGKEDCAIGDDNPSVAHVHVYSCVCPARDPGDADCSTKKGIEAYCCPRRAIACIQPKDEGYFGGGGVAAQTRWWYNSASSNCEALSYRGIGGNGNNFQTKALCETYCKTICLRGNPATKPADSQTAEETPTICTATTQCNEGASTNYYCYLQGKGSFSMCCPTPKYICSPNGGIPLADEKSPDSGEPSYNSRNFTRFYYDTTASKCLPFPYFGLGGNFNNFQTEAECRTFCSSSACTVGEPLRDNSGNLVTCGAGCPAKYICSELGNCCPSTDFVCGQLQAVGGCSSYSERWWFNPTTRSCEKFFYSGCQGNFNNFLTYQDCIERCGGSSAQIKCPQGEPVKDSSGAYIVCSGATTSLVNRCPSDYYCHFDQGRYGCCPTRAKTCSFDYMDQGTLCITPVSRWYYNSVTRLCDVFTYNGCDGNSNNFATKIDCQDYCGVGGCPEGGEPFRDTYNGQYRVCGNEMGTTECPNGYTCTIVTLGTTTRRNYCCPTRAHVCSMTQDAGSRCGTQTLQRVYFNAVTKTCDPFTYNGCGGNRNNFANTDQCLTYCNSAGCQAGQVALQDAGTKRVTTCDHNIANSCASGYSCVFSPVLSQGICCGSNAPLGSCPSGQNAYIDSFTNTPLQCQPNVDFSCPNGIFCQYSFIQQNAFCCGTAGAQCSNGGSPLLNSMTSQPVQCMPGMPNVCTTGFTCQAASVVVGGVTSTTGYCCGQPNVCGGGYAPYYVNNQPVACVITQMPSSCPSPYACRQVDMTTYQSYCCVVVTQMVVVCPVGKTSLLTQGAPTLCTQTSPNTGCPSGYTCDLYTTTGSYYCCRFGSGPGPEPPITASCPPPHYLLQPIRTCSPGTINTCPFNYFCSYDAINLRYVCCGSGSVTTPPFMNPCPNGQPYINPTSGRPQACRLGTPSTGCPLNFGCAYSAALRNYYCCTGTRPVPTARPPGFGDVYGCPMGNAYLYPGTRTPLSCKQNSGPACPVGYSCQRSTRGNAYQCCSTMKSNRLTGSG